MNNAQKKYAVRRILEISGGKKASIGVEKPDLTLHMRQAAVDGNLRPKPPRELLRLARAVVIGTNSDFYANDTKFSMEDIFCEPDSYKVAVKEFNAAELQARRKNEGVATATTRIIDDVHLDQYEDAHDAIRDAMEEIPQA